MSIFIYNDKLLNAAECNSIIELANLTGLQQSHVTSSDGTANKVISLNRTSQNLGFSYGKHAIIDVVYKHISNMTSLPIENIELEINRYSIGQYFMLHYDHLQPEWIINGGQRLYSCIIYLNDDFEGGETHFANISETVKPIKGNAVAWRNCIPGSTILDIASMHESLIITKGVKWALIAWVRESKLTKPLQTTN